MHVLEQYNDDWKLINKRRTEIGHNHIGLLSVGVQQMSDKADCVIHFPVDE